MFSAGTVDAVEDPFTKPLSICAPMSSPTMSRTFLPLGAIACAVWGGGCLSWALEAMQLRSVATTIIDRRIRCPEAISRFGVDQSEHLHRRKDNFLLDGAYALAAKLLVRRIEMHTVARPLVGFCGLPLTTFAMVVSFCWCGWCECAKLR